MTVAVTQRKRSRTGGTIPAGSKPAETTDQRVRCPYCLGGFVPTRSDATYCSGSCRMAACRAIAAEDLDPPSLGTRRENHSEERRKATGYGSLTCAESYSADLRVRAIARGRVETLSEWDAVDALPGGPRRLQLTPEQWAGLRVVLERQRAELADWLARQTP